MRIAIESILTVGFALVLSLTIFSLASGAKAQLLSFDFDGDGVPDEEDLCPLTTDLTGPIPTETLCEGCLSDAETVQGCNAEDVLACKPGPNYHDRKFGVPARVVDKFINKLAWAKKCSYDPPPPPPPPETSGTASDVEELVLNLPGASFTVPPAALPGGTPVTFSYENANVIEPDLLGPSETIITLVYSLAFSVQQRSAETMTLDIEVPAGITDGIYAFIRVTSDLSNDTPSTAEWLPLPGEYDSTAGRFRIELGATGELFSIFVVTRTESSSTASIFQKLETRLATVERWMERAVDSITDLFRASTAFAGQTVRGELRERGWAAFCRPEKFLPEDQSLCQPGSPALQALAGAMYDAAVNLNDQGLLGPAVLYSELRQYMESTGLPFATSEPVGFPPSDEYYVVYMFDPGGGLDGQYNNPPGVIAVNADSINNATPIHEIFHAVTEADCPRSVQKQWIDESHAAAVETWDPSWAGTASDWRFGIVDDDPTWRNWGLPLNRTMGGSAPYQTLAPYTLGELWLEADPGLLYLPNLVNRCAVLPADVPTADEYVQYDSWMQGAGGPPLADAFVSVIEKRAADGDYPYCGSLLDPNNPDGPRVLVDPVECTTEPCELSDTLDLALQRMTAKCFRPLVTLPPSDVCPGEEIYTIQFGGDPDVNRYIFDGTTYEPGDTIQGAPTAFKLWALDKGIDNPLAFSEGSVLISTSCPDQPPPPPEPPTSIQIASQRVWVSAGAGPINYPCGLPQLYIEWKEVLSFDDGSQPSVLRTLTRADDVTTQEEQPIDPIGFGPTSLSASAQLTVPFPDQDPLGLCADVSGLLMSGDSNFTVGINPTNELGRPAIDITGQGTVNVVNEPQDDDTGANWIYSQIFVASAPIDVFVNHSCELSYVRLYNQLTNENILIRKHFRSLNQGSGPCEDADWTCEPFSVTLPPGTYGIESQMGLPSSVYCSQYAMGGSLSGDFSVILAEPSP